MSGLKVTPFTIAREISEKLRLLPRLKRQHAAAEGLKANVTSLLDGMSEGLRNTFRAEVESARHWVQSVKLPVVDDLTTEVDLNFLDYTGNELRATVEEGKRIEQMLVTAIRRKADQLGQQLTARLTDIEQQCQASQPLVQTWLGNTVTDAWDARLQEARAMLDAERYNEMTQVLDGCQAEVETASRQAEVQEEKQQKRLYLLKALRQVCAEMGFEEVGPPQYERPGDRMSALQITVDTIDRGMIDFTITMDGMTSHSDLADQHCFEEFGQLSSFLEEQFGIHTEFKMENGEPLRDLKARGEKDLPDGATISREV